MLMVSLLASLQFDFGYPWWVSYGQMIVLLPAVALMLIAWKRRRPAWIIAFFAVLVLWSASALLVTRFVLDVNGVPELPTQAFLRAGKGRVVDLGAGTGRSSLMVLQNRPEVTLVALDLFQDSFDEHFGHSETPEQKILANWKAAGVDGRATVQKGDMRKLPFESASFDAAVSAYAVDHLNRKGITESLAEAARVVRPGGDFLVMLIGKEPWAQYAFGPLLMHMGTRGPDLVDNAPSGSEVSGSRTRKKTDDHIFLGAPDIRWRVTDFSRGEAVPTLRGAASSTLGL